jgi:hypothetical protein
MSVEPNLSIFVSWSKKLNIVHKTIVMRVCWLNREHVVDRHALQVIHWIGEYFWHMYCHVFNYAIHKR